MSEEKKYIVIYNYYNDMDENACRDYFGPETLETCEKHISDIVDWCGEVENVTYYEVKPVKGRYEWKED